MDGAFGRYVDVDLTSHVIAEREIDPSWYQLYLGGRGVAARLMLDLVPPDVDPYAPENAIILATGPLQGTGAAGAGRHVVMTVSPKSRSILDSYAGGYVGHELGRSGFDGIIIRGRSKAPVYLLLEDGHAELLPAEDLWGRPTGDVDDVLRSRHPGVRVACIGPAGENRVQMACLIHDKTRASGRPGVGAVMGSKNLKAVAVHGTQEKPIAEPSAFSAERTAFVQTIANDNTKARLARFGTPGVLLGLDEIGALPTKAFLEGTFEGAAAISGERMAETILVNRETCVGCPIRCKRVVETRFGSQDVVPDYGGPEYETLAAFGSLCLCSDLDAIACANQLCNAYGLDTISCGVAIASLMEASERGLVGEDVRWGDPEAIIQWIERIAGREGLGDRIADGTHAWAGDLGLPSILTIKGVELPMHEPRGKVGLGLSYAVSPRGATHLESIHDTMAAMDRPTPEVGIDRPMDRFAVAGKAHAIDVYTRMVSFTNSAIVCLFVVTRTGSSYNYPAIRRHVELATGHPLSIVDMQRIGERNMALLRLYAGLAGYRRSDDRLPVRFHEPLPRGGSAGRPIDKELFQQEIDSYYERCGWDSHGPTDARLESLGMDDLVGRLKR